MNVVDAAFEFLILQIEWVDSDFKLVNTDVDVAFKFLILKIELDDNEFKLVNIVVEVAFKLLMGLNHFFPNFFSKPIFPNSLEKYGKWLWKKFG